MRVSAVSLFLALAGFLKFNGAAANSAMIIILFGEHVLNATFDLNRVNHRPAWVTTSPQRTAENYHVFTEMHGHGLYEGSLERGWTYRAYAENLPMFATVDIGTSHYEHREVFKIYDEAVHLNASAIGYLFVKIPGPTHVFYAELKVESQ